MRTTYFHLVFVLRLALLCKLSLGSSFAPVSNLQQRLSSPAWSRIRGGVRNNEAVKRGQQLQPTPPSEPLAASLTPPPPDAPIAGDIEAATQQPPAPVVDVNIETTTKDAALAPTDLSTSEVAAATAAAVNFSSGLGPKAPPPGWLRRKFPNFPWHRLPNFLTYARCAAIPGLMALFYTPGRNVESGVLFALASFTDWLDGYLARKWDVSSTFGAFLDPVADKLTVSTALVLLSGWYGALVVIPAIIIIAREIAVSALREWMAQRGQRDAVQVGLQGKVKTALTMVALTLLLLVPTSGEGKFLAFLEIPGLVLLYLSAVLTVTSGSAYFRAAAPSLLS